MARPAFGLGGFRVWLGLVVAAGAAIRFAYVRGLAPATPKLSDGPWFREVSDHVIHGHGFTLHLGHGFVPTATHPPLYPLWLALVRAFGAHSDLALRTTGTLLGAATVLLIGLLGRRIGGTALGVGSAAIVAIHPLLIASDGSLFSEGLYDVTIAGSMLAVLWLHEAPSIRRAIAAGVCIGLAALTRSEALLLVLMLLPVLWRVPPRRRLGLFAAAAVAAVLVVSPWVVRNWSELGRPVFSNNYGNLVSATNNHATYYEAPHLGALGAPCIAPPGKDETGIAAFCMRVGAHYAVHHVVRWPVIVPVRILRGWSFWAPFVHYSSDAGRNLAVEHAGIVFDYVVLLLAIPGVIALRRRRAPLSILLAPIILVTFIAATTYGSVRLRQAAEPPLAVLAAAGAIEVGRRFRTRRET